jgi:hypothetical protein
VWMADGDTRPFEDRPAPDPGVPRPKFLDDLAKASQRVKPQKPAGDVPSDVAEEGEEHRPRIVAVLYRNAYSSM